MRSFANGAHEVPHRLKRYAADPAAGRHGDAPAAQPAGASSSGGSYSSITVSSTKGVISPSKGAGSSMTPSMSETMVLNQPSGCGIA